MSERFIVLHAPDDPAQVKEQKFSRKGTAFAYVKKRMPHCQRGSIEVRHQVGGGVTLGSEFEPTTHHPWTTIDTWTFHRDGRIDHVRVRA